MVKFVLLDRGLLNRWVKGFDLPLNRQNNWKSLR
jgi:hypothetical protein